MSTQTLDHPAFRAALREFGPRSLNIIDVGARWGTVDAWFRVAPLARIFGFEPDAVECQRLNSLFKSDSEQFYPYALGRVDGDATRYVTGEPACSSLFPSSEFMRERFPTLRSDMAPARETLIPVKRMETWAAMSEVKRVDFIKIDTQGSELDVLQGANDLLDECIGVEAEVMFSPLYKNQPLFADIDAYLRGRGFTLWRLSNLAHYAERPNSRLLNSSTVHFDLTSVHHQTGDGRLVWANAIYFKDRANLSNRRSLLALATMLEAAGDRDGSESCLNSLACYPQTPASVSLDREERIRAIQIPEGDLKRLRMTIGCKDSDEIPKVRCAGSSMVEGDVRLQLMHNGLKIVEGCYHGPWMTAIIEFLGGHHEPQEERAFFEILKYVQPGANMIELGSFWAYYSMWFAKTLPGGRNLMIEPDAANLQVGQRNFTLNGLVGEFMQGSIGRNNDAPKPFLWESDGATHMVPQYCVDELIRQSNLPRVDLLLADIQGAELEMLHGASDSIDRGLLRFIFVSTHHHAISKDPLIHQKCVEFIREHQGHILIEHSVTESFSGDGLIVASFDPADRQLPPIHVSRNWPSNSLFRQSEYDLAEACAAIEELGQEFVGLVKLNPQIASELNRIRQKNSTLAKNWPEFA